MLIAKAPHNIHNIRKTHIFSKLYEIGEKYQIIKEYDCVSDFKNVLCRNYMLNKHFRQNPKAV